MTRANEPAFPNLEHTIYEKNQVVTKHEHQLGMTLREYFAGQLLAGMLAGGGEYASWESAAKDSVEAVDALIAQLEKEDSDD